MKKIPTIFERDWNGDRSRVLDQINPNAQWVFDGEGIATQKIDGTCCMIRGGKLFKRREAKEQDLANNPIADFEIIDRDMETGKVFGWVPVGPGAEDRWHREAFERETRWPDGTYELVGPKVQGNPEGEPVNVLIAHSTLAIAPETLPVRTFASIRNFLSVIDMEGIVFHHPDGRFAKIKGRDFGIRRRK